MISLYGNMWKGSENAKPLKMAAARKNMFPSSVNADYALRAEQRQQTSGQMKFIITLIKNNQNRRGASIEKVISEAAGRASIKNMCSNILSALNSREKHTSLKMVR